MSLANVTKFADFRRVTYGDEGMLIIPSYSKSSYNDYNREEKPKENKDMNAMGMFNGMLKRLEPDMVRLGINGELAVKTPNGSSYKTYNVKTGNLVNVTQFCFDLGKDLFFAVPTAKVQVGDIVLLEDANAPNGIAPKCVVSLKDGKTIEVMDYGTNQIQTIVPERHFFLGQMYFYSKITSFIPIGNLKDKKGTAKLGQLMAMQAVFGGNSGGFSPFGGNGDDNIFMSMYKMSLMTKMMNGGEMADMFDFSNMFEFEVPDFDITDPENETPEEKKARLKAELAALEAEEENK